MAEAREGVWEGTWRRWGGGVVGGGLEAAGLEACTPEGPPGGAPGGREREGTRSKAGKCQRKIGPE